MTRGIDFDLGLIDSALSTGHIILVPNARLRDAIFRELGRRQGDGVLRSPRVYAIDIWIRTCWQQLAQQGQAPCCDRHLLDAREELLVWTRLVEDSLDRYPLLNPGETARALSHAYQLLKQWQLQGSDGQQLQAFTGIADVAAFLYWQQTFTEYCEDKQCLNLVDAVEQLLPVLASSDQDAQFCLVNFDQPPPLYAQLLDSLPIAQRCFTTSADAVESDNLQRSRVDFPDRTSEIRACAYWAAAQINSQPGIRLGVICNDPETYKTEFQRHYHNLLAPDSVLDLSSRPRHINSAGGPLLTDYAVIRDALLILGLHSDRQQSENLCRLLRSPFVAGYRDELDARQAMELTMRRRFSAQCSSARFSSTLQQEDKPQHCPQLAAMLLNFRNRIRQAAKLAPAREWMEVFRDLLDCLGWPGTALTEREQPALEQWQQLLVRLAGSSELLGPMSFAEALRRLQMACQQTHVDTGYNPQSGLSFYTPTEAAGLLFDKLWLLGFTDQSWPSSVAPSPFLPYELQRDNKLPGSHSDVQYSMAETTFNQLCNATAEAVVASYPRFEGEQELRPSSFIREFATDDTSVQIASESPLNPYSVARLGQMHLQQITDQDVPVADDEQVSGGQQILSDQSACPFRAFASHRLQAAELEPFSSGLDARSRGSAIHKALETLFGTITTHRQLLEMSAEQKLALCQTAAAQAIDYLQWAQTDLMTPGLRALELQRITALLSGFLDAEAQRGDYTIVDQEKQINWQFDGLELSLRIDRIDRLDDGSLAVIDYKSGKFTPSRQSWLQERPEDMQLPFYAVASSEALDEPVSVISLAHVNAEKLGYSGLAEKANFHPALKPVAEDRRLQLDWKQINEHFHLKVEYLAHNFVTGQHQVDPANGFSTCKYCGLQPLCRVHQQIESHGEQDDLVVERYDD